MEGDASAAALRETQELLVAAHDEVEAAQLVGQQDLRRAGRIIDAARAIHATNTLDALFQQVVHSLCGVVHADRASLFLVDEAKGELWSKVAEGIDRTIRVPLGVGLV